LFSLLLFFLFSFYFSFQRGLHVSEQKPSRFKKEVFIDFFLSEKMCGKSRHFRLFTKNIPCIIFTLGPPCLFELLNSSTWF
jgi:hypothetical protein